MDQHNHGGVCTADGCCRPAAARGMCSSHYAQAWRDEHTTPRCGTWRQSLAAIDPIAVDRLVAGEPPEFYTAFERREAVRRLVAAGTPRRAVARQLGIDDRQVYRDLLDARVVPLPVVLPVDVEAVAG